MTEVTALHQIDEPAFMLDQLSSHDNHWYCASAGRFIQLLVLHVPIGEPLWHFMGFLNGQSRAK